MLDPIPSTRQTLLPPTPVLQLHIEPDRPIEVLRLTSALASVSRQYEYFVDAHPTFGRGATTRLLVSNVSPGSIDVSLLPDWASMAGILASAYEPMKFLVDFAEKLKWLLEFFKGRSEVKAAVSVADCDDAINIAAPIANHGGTQSVTIINGPVHMPILVMNAEEAQRIIQTASEVKLQLQSPAVDTRQRVPLTWSQLNRDSFKTTGKTSPDKGIIEEIDEQAKPVFFTDEMQFLKAQMIGDDENPYKKIYFVDVQVSYANKRVASYRVIGYHGKEDFAADLRS